MAAILNGLNEGDVLFIDEIHRLNTTVEEYLYSAMEDFFIDIMIDQGPGARSVRLNIPRFTLIGATTRQGMLSAPLRSRFLLSLRLDYYAPEDLRDIVLRSSKILNIEIDSAGALEIARRSRGTPRIANNLLRWTRDYAQVKAAVMAVKAQVDSVCDIQNVPCHNDPLCENWVVSADDDRLYLIDWEYAGMNDGIWDLADVSIEGVFTPENDELLLTEYLGSKPDQNEYKHFLANKIYVDYLWTLWAKTRVPYDGQPMEDWAVERYARLKDNLRLFAEA